MSEVETKGRFGPGLVKVVNDELAVTLLEALALAKTLMIKLCLVRFLTLPWLGGGVPCRTRLVSRFWYLLGLPCVP